MLSFLDPKINFRMEDIKKNEDKPVIPPPASGGIDKSIFDAVFRVASASITGGTKTDPTDPTKKIDTERWSSAAELLIPRIIDDILENRGRFFSNNKPNAAVIIELVKAYVEMYYLVLLAFVEAKKEADKALKEKLK